MYRPDHEESYRAFIEQLEIAANSSRPAPVTLGLRYLGSDETSDFFPLNEGISDLTPNVVGGWRLLLQRAGVRDMCLIHEPPAGPEGESLLFGHCTTAGSQGVWRAFLKKIDRLWAVVNVQQVADSALPEHLHTWMIPVDTQTTPPEKLAAYRKQAAAILEEWGPELGWPPLREGEELGLTKSGLGARH